MPTTTANSVAPSIIAAVMIIAVEIWPAAAGCRPIDSTADMRYLVLPLRPTGTEGWSEERLAALVTRDSMVGVSVPTAA